MIRIDRLMKMRGVGPQQLATGVDISQGHASNIKAGRRSPKLELAKDIATFLAHPVDGIFFGYALAKKSIEATAK